MKMFNPIIYLTLLLFVACNKDSDPINSNEPSGLNLEVIISEDGSGDITIAATAHNTIEYHFFMGDGSSTDPIVREDGILNYTYNVLGSYQIEVRAYGLSGRYIKKTKRLLINSGIPVSTGQGYVSASEYEGMTLVWNDEFNGNTLDQNSWTHQIGTGCPNLCGWGNEELEYYREQNTSVGNGVVTIEARKEDYQGSEYTSSRIITRGKKSFKYGRVDIRAILPKGQGLWPALWMLGSNHESVGWPKSGEIDIMEMVGGSGRENRITGNLFWDENGTRDQVGGTILPSGTFNDEYHVFSIIWDEDEIKWLMNDELYHTVDITHPERSEFRNEFYFLFNVAVGGNHPGNPDETTILPTSMSVDYIRVFQTNP